MDLCGPSRIQTPSGKLYFMLTIDYFNRMMWETFFREKLDVLQKFKNFKAMVENEKDCKIKYITSDNEGEFTSKEFDDFCKQHGIKRKFTTKDIP